MEEKEYSEVDNKKQWFLHIVGKRFFKSVNWFRIIMVIISFILGSLSSIGLRCLLNW